MILDHCVATAEVMTPDAMLREITCGKRKRGHGWWHSNRQVHWPGRFVQGETIGEASERLLREAFA